MHGGSAEILQEYLVSLGYKTDLISLKKFEDGMGSTQKKIFGVGTAAATMLVALEAATAAFSYHMRKMYFASELSNSTVKNMESMSFAGEQIGVSGESMQGALHGMAQAMRLNPGLQGLVESFGVKVTGRDTSDVMMDFVRALKQMPEFAAAQYAAMIGIDADTYHQMISHMDTLAKKKREMLEIYRAAGVDPDAAKKTILAYTEALDKLEARLSMLGQAMMITFAKPFQQASEYLNTMVDDLTRWMVAVGKGEGTSELSKQIKRDLIDFGIMDEEKESEDSKLVHKLEKKYQLPPGLIQSQLMTGHDPSKLTTGPTVGRLTQAVGEYQRTHLGAETRLGVSRSEGSSITLQQKTDIHVHGQDASSTAKAVVREQDRVNGDLVRNMKGR